MVERARPTANFRLLIVNGTVYMERYRQPYQTRDVFTWWGILQLMRRYPGRLPDLDLMFDCDDLPTIRSDDYKGPLASAPPPLFRYCADNSTLDIVFPDWSFWGWPEINIKPWGQMLKQLREINKMMIWSKKEPYAYWKGNPNKYQNRLHLMKCNSSHNQDWNARIYVQDWKKEVRKGFKNSDLAKQCIHRYKIYVEGNSWSVSEKYILACNSMALIVKPIYYDFFTRSLMPLKHYWPIKEQDMCRSIKFAVDFGNSHQPLAQEIGNMGSKFVQEELKMEYVYDYMFHLLNEYSKLLLYKPTVPKKAVEYCSEVMGCSASGFVKQSMKESVEIGPSNTEPCTMPPPFDSTTLRDFLDEKENQTKEVEHATKGHSYVNARFAPAYERKRASYLSDLPLALLKQYSQGKDRWHSAALTDVSDWTPHLDHLIYDHPAERTPLLSEILAGSEVSKKGYLVGAFLGLIRIPFLRNPMVHASVRRGYRTVPGKH
ncbi:hypothetical protein NE237_008300 [Protea cynaroides]|uniref:Glycosyl transferase CAP10 domain-containing protein n=1 Tax=Protea cynaroides TaxID=273540 RepID=A0A9Q0GMU2_9MAGN|nr:hypothetical protein NE237_008300 [Protea cynaroides]